MQGEKDTGSEDGKVPVEDKPMPVTVLDADTFDASIKKGRVLILLFFFLNRHWRLRILPAIPEHLYASHIILLCRRYFR